MEMHYGLWDFNLKLLVDCKAHKYEFMGIMGGVSHRSWSMVLTWTLCSRGLFSVDPHTHSLQWDNCQGRHRRILQVNVKMGYCY